jgi:hypothetical protein
MALDYYLHLATSTSPKQALERLASHVDRLTWSDDNSCLFDETVTITAVESRALTRSIIEESFQFTPALTVGFRCAKFADQDTFAHLLLDATLLLLEDAQDAVVLFNGEFLVLQRLRGHLTFNADSGLWHDEHWLKSRLTLPFERRPLPSPLL